MNKISKKRLISRKRTLAFAFLLTLLFLLTIQDARGETFADSHTIGSTMNTHFDSKDNQTVSIQAQNTFWAFLNQVAGLDTNTYNLDRFIVNNHAVEGSKRIRTSINSIISNQRENLSISMVVIQGKVAFYELNVITGQMVDVSTLTYGDYAFVGKDILEKYRQFFDASYCSEFENIIPVSIEREHTTINNQDSQVTITYDLNSTSNSRQTEFYCNKEIAGQPIPAQSIQIKISNNMLTFFADRIGVSKVASTTIGISKEGATELGLKIINDYAKTNGRMLKSLNSSLYYVQDINGSRGDSYDIYPLWSIEAKFTNSGLSNVFGYSVFVWADNGEIQSAGPLGTFKSVSNSLPNGLFISLMIVFAVIPLIMIMSIVRQRRKNNTMSFTKIIGSLLFLTALLLSSVIWEPVAAYPASIYGSMDGVDQFELPYDDQITDLVESWSNEIGYNADNWYGAQTTSNNIYYGAYDQGESGSIVFYIGHAGYHTDDFWYSEWPFLFHRYRYVLTDNGGNYVRDVDIYDNSNAQAYDHKKFVFLWACEQGDTIGGFTYYGNPQDVTEAQGMPFAWLHTNSLSGNGYTDPDTSGQAFIGWTDGAPFLREGRDGIAQAGYYFLTRFYTAALLDGWNLHDSLDYAADMWSTDFGSCPFSVDDYPVGHIVVYGQGDLYVGRSQFISDISDCAHGWSYDSGTAYEDRLTGSQNDGQSAELWAMECNDWAWITGQLSGDAIGNVHVRCKSDDGLNTLVRVYVSPDYSTWYYSSDVWVSNSGFTDINFGNAYGDEIRYVGISVLNNDYVPGHLYVDAVHVY